ncbi:DUF2235 domain-containing protein [Mesorhizobium sp. WSM1293]|uniref:DUF2235 domain-containing protein n=1 Tax=Mesorhizobium sp. WSM1293 TaxID=1040984 RepID=UPI0004B3F776|nr:DUF2235 domain-containing protein [Mesorhizobium sp. WSM1293]
MGKNIVVCCDGTGNQIERNLSNVLKLFRILKKNEEQRVYYDAGIGTIGASDAWARWRQNTKSVFELATGYGLDAEIAGAYEFICRHYVEGDAIFLFGFSRGAYTVRAVAGLIHMIGLLQPDQLNIVRYAVSSYKQASDENDLSVAWHFSKVSGARDARIKFLGVWDTVASVIVPRKDRLLPQLQTLPHTRTNPSVEVFRHAIAIDEHRRMFRLNRWVEPQPFVENPFDKTAPVQEQDIRQVWFAGCHSDVGGGYPEEDSAISKFPLDWMIDEATAFGLQINSRMRERLVFGTGEGEGKMNFVGPSPLGTVHDSVTWGWKPLEWIPKSAKWREWKRKSALGFYLPQAEPRMIERQEPQPFVHQSVLDRKAAVSAYKPENFPVAFDVEPYSDRMKEHLVKAPIQLI